MRFSTRSNDSAHTKVFSSREKVETFRQKLRDACEAGWWRNLCTSTKFHTEATDESLSILFADARASSVKLKPKVSDLHGISHWSPQENYWSQLSLRDDGGALEWFDHTTLGLTLAQTLRLSKPERELEAEISGAQRTKFSLELLKLASGGDLTAIRAHCDYVAVKESLLFAFTVDEVGAVLDDDSLAGVNTSVFSGR